MAQWLWFAFLRYFTSRGSLPQAARPDASRAVFGRHRLKSTIDYHICFQILTPRSLSTPGCPVYFMYLLAWHLRPGNPVLLQILDAEIRTKIVSSQGKLIQLYRTTTIPHFKGRTHCWVSPLIVISLKRFAPSFFSHKPKPITLRPSPWGCTSFFWGSNVQAFGRLDLNSAHACSTIDSTKLLDFWPC